MPCFVHDGSLVAAVVGDDDYDHGYGDADDDDLNLSFERFYATCPSPDNYRNYQNTHTLMILTNKFFLLKLEWQKNYLKKLNY